MTRYAAGSIFALKNFGWTDKQEIDHTSKGEKMGFDIKVSDASKDETK